MVDLSRPAAAARVISLYLPQFHPIPENDLWWGPGFTEWSNVTTAQPLFRGHQQPYLPSDLGYYDLRVGEVRERQAELARAAGVESFCYWHYWFGNGRRILERPFEEVLSSRAPDFPFCLAWANQTWSGIWHGAPNRTLIEQAYPGRADEKAHFEWARRAFEDPRYTCVEGKPLFMVYSPTDLPSTEAFVDHWRELAHQAGYPGLYLVGVSEGYARGEDRYRRKVLEPFDAVTLLGPGDYLAERGDAVRRTLQTRLKERNFGKLNHMRPQSWARPRRLDFADVVRNAYEDMPQGERYLPSVLAGWDNTPRSGVRGVVCEDFSPELLEVYLRKAVAQLADHPAEKKIVFLKAWNEWAEGNVVEPSLRHGHRALQAIRRAITPDGIIEPEPNADLGPALKASRKLAGSESLVDG